MTLGPFARFVVGKGRTRQDSIMICPHKMSNDAGGTVAKGDMEHKLAAWLSGRNGSDELSTCALVVAVLLVGLNMLLNSFLVSVIALVLMAYAWWRMSSKNLEARENENGVFVESLGPLRPWVRNPVQAMGEARAYKHIKCPECGQRVRVPRGKGKVRIKCPKCHHTFESRA